MVDRIEARAAVNQRQDVIGDLGALPAPLGDASGVFLVERPVLALPAPGEPGEPAARVFRPLGVVAARGRRGSQPLPALAAARAGTAAADEGGAVRRRTGPRRRQPHPYGSSPGAGDSARRRRRTTNRSSTQATAAWAVTATAAKSAMSPRTTESTRAACAHRSSVCVMRRASRLRRHAAAHGTARTVRSGAAAARSRSPRPPDGAVVCGRPAACIARTAPADTPR